MREIIQNNRRNLPHFQREDDIIGFTLRLAFTLPTSVLQRLSEFNPNPESPEDEEAEQQKYRFLDEYLGKNDLGEITLCQPEIAGMLCRALEYHDAKLYELHTYCIMANHLHFLIKPIKNEKGSFAKIADIIKNFKTFTAKEINKISGHEGKVWEADYYDRFIRDYRDYGSTVEYIMNNPVKAGLVDKAEDWPYSRYFSKDV